MSRSFNGSSDKITVSTAVNAGTYPASVWCWFYPTVTTAQVDLLSIDAGTLASAAEFGLNSTGKLMVNSAGHQTPSAAAVNANAWNSGGGVFSGGSSDAVYLNGTKTTAGNGSAFAAQTTTRLGVRFNGGGFFTGNIAEMAVWNTQLTDAEFAALATGVLPHRIRPQNLVAYWPLWGLSSPEPDLSGNANNGTLTGTAFANHAPVTLFTKKAKSQVEPAAAAGPVLIPRLVVVLPPPSPALFE